MGFRGLLGRRLLLPGVHRRRLVTGDGSFGAWSVGATFWEVLGLRSSVRKVAVIDGGGLLVGRSLPVGLLGCGCVSNV